MGFIWSKPVNPLKESLLPGGPTVALNTGDIILIPNSDLEIVLNNDIWKGVGIALSPVNVWYDGDCFSFNALLNAHEAICLRQLNCRRPSEFNQRFVQAIRSETNVAKMLVKMGLLASEENVTPQHFSSESPYGVHLPMYSNNVFL